MVQVGRRRWLLAASVALALGPGRGDAVPEDLPLVREGSPATVTLRFAAPPRCVGGTNDGALCRALADCGGGATGCVADPATPSRLVYRVDYVPLNPRRTPVALVAPVTLIPIADTVTITWPDNPIVNTDNLDERHLLTVTWEPPGGGPSSSDEIPFLVRNLALVPAPTPTP